MKTTLNLWSIFYFIKKGSNSNGMWGGDNSTAIMLGHTSTAFIGRDFNFQLLKHRELDCIFN